ncbi:hypothetical protein JTE90_018201 [Oedothorax gibbosus]|uniref:Uncharacterized protein n=1 Tax=Oedothorax gibbosus TaxID=931172 RepID=A0AAV6U7P6_9ARAC|nr:hypothetical protein JTE90_018201 [Oedothorax gibbosus]
MDNANCEANEWGGCGLGDDSFIEDGNDIIEPLLNADEFIKNIQSVLASFSLRIRELHCIPAVVHTDIMNSMAEVIRVIMKQLLKTIAGEKKKSRSAFSPLVADLQALEESGVTVTSSSDIEYKFEVRVATLSGDNLSSHAIGGFRQCFSSGRICRFCMITHDAISNVTSENEVTLCYIPNHSYHVTAVQMSAGNVSAYVAGKSVISTLKIFHPVTCLPPDPMHDLLEDVLPAFISALLQEL